MSRRPKTTAEQFINTFGGQSEKQKEEATAAAAAAATTAQRRTGKNLFLRCLNPRAPISIKHNKSGLEYTHSFPGYEVFKGLGGMVTVNGHDVQIEKSYQPDTTLTWYLNGLPCMVVISNTTSTMNLTNFYNYLDKFLPAKLYDIFKGLIKDNDPDKADARLGSALKTILDALTAYNKKGTDIGPAVAVVMTYPYRNPDHDIDELYVSAKGTGDILIGMHHLGQGNKNLCETVRPAYQVSTSDGITKPKITAGNVYGENGYTITMLIDEEEHGDNVTLFAITGSLIPKLTQPMAPISLKDGGTLEGFELAVNFDPRTIVSQVLEQLDPKSDFKTGGVCAYLKVPTVIADRKDILRIQKSEQQPEFYKPSAEDELAALAGITALNKKSSTAPARSAAAPPPAYTATTRASAPARPAAAAPTATASSNAAAPTPASNSSAAAPAAPTTPAAAVKPGDERDNTTAKGIITTLKSFSPKFTEGAGPAKNKALEFLLENSTATINECELNKKTFSLTQAELITLFDSIKNIFGSEASTKSDLKYLFKSSRTFGTMFKDERDEASKKLLAGIKNTLMATVDAMRAQPSDKLYDGSLRNHDTYENSDLNRVLDTPVDGSTLAEGQHTQLGIRFGSYTT